MSYLCVSPGNIAREPIRRLPLASVRICRLDPSVRSPVKKKKNQKPKQALVSYLLLFNSNNSSDFAFSKNVGETVSKIRQMLCQPPPPENVSKESSSKRTWSVIEIWGHRGPVGPAALPLQGAHNSQSRTSAARHVRSAHYSHRRARGQRVAGVGGGRCEARESE